MPNLDNLLVRARAKALSYLLPRPYEAKWGSYSFIAETDTDVASERLIDVSLEGIRRARMVSFDDLQGRLSAETMEVLRRWPGEHYRLLAGICATLKPKTVVEIGTASGLSALALLSELPSGSRLVTFDILPWDYKGPEAWGGEVLLRAEDFANGRLSQFVGDLSNDATFEKHRALLEQADFLFVDGPKDGVFEQQFLDRLGSVRFATPPLVMFDDVRLWNMVRIWKNVRRPKLDLTSFGHWSGTGLIDWR
jgi:predicted O-methyltransferase YrrM